MFATRLAVALATAAALALAFALPSGAVDSLQWVGTWGTSYGTMVVKEDGSGTYDFCNGKLQGSISGDVYTGTWSQTPGCSNATEPTGTFKFTIDTKDPAPHFVGEWTYTSTPDSINRYWDGTKETTPAPTGSLTIAVARCGSFGSKDETTIVVRPPCKSWIVTATLEGPSDIHPYRIDIEDAVAPASLPKTKPGRCATAGRYAGKHPRATCQLVRGQGFDTESVELKAPPPGRAMTVRYRAVLRTGPTTVRTSRVVTVVFKPR